MNRRDEMKTVDFDYKKIQEEFQIYKNFSETTIDVLKEKVESLEKRIDTLSSLMEISKYINLNVSDEFVIRKINDMIIGIMGVEFSTIYIKKDGELVVEATNIKEEDLEAYEKNYYNVLDKRKSFILNCKTHNDYSINGSDYHSIIGVPISLKERILGYIVVEQSIWEYFSMEHINFLKTISNHVGIALENNFLYMKIMESSIRDPLLNIYNRKYFFDKVEEMILEDPEKKFAIVMLDIDDFKKLNDKYGHQFGDRVLNHITKVIDDNLLEEDVFARYGGEELIIYTTDDESYLNIVNRVENLRKKLGEEYLVLRDEKVMPTVSFGIGFYPINAVMLDTVVSVADTNLYVSKSTGKDRVTYGF